MLASSAPPVPPVSLLEPVPVAGLAHSGLWKSTAPGSTKAPGKNHPLAGAWLISRYAPANGVAADPMIGVGGLWLQAPNAQVKSLYGCDIESRQVSYARSNCGFINGDSSAIEQADARTWCPPTRPDLVLFSPPFLQNHSAGATKHQQDIIKKKALYTMQEFGDAPGNLGRLKEPDFWAGMATVYLQIRKYANPGGHVVVILRNRIRRGSETDEVGRHVGLLQQAGLIPVGAHCRDLERPSGYQAWKVARNPNTPWVRFEWAIVARA